MQLQGKRVLVTGADGFIGSHLAERLVREGCRVRAFVYYNSFNSWGWLDSIPGEVSRELDIHAGDVRDAHSVRGAVQECDVVFHLAALIAIPYSYRAPDAYVDTNVKGTLNVVQAARDLGTERVVHTSTSETYGTARYVPIDEEHPLQAQSPYSASKIGADQIALSFHRSFDTPISVLRPFNTYGPRQSARAVIPTIITQLAKGERTLRLGSLHPTRDFSYVADTVAAFVAVAQADAAVGEVVNAGSGFEVSIGETAALIAKAMNVEMDTALDAERVRPALSEVDRLWAATDKASRLAGWSPAFGGREGFERGLRETIDWFSQPDNLARYKTGIYNV